jgi:hypothetical protein
VRYTHIHSPILLFCIYRNNRQVSLQKVIYGNVNVLKLGIPVGMCKLPFRAFLFDCML